MTASLAKDPAGVKLAPYARDRPDCGLPALRPGHGAGLAAPIPGGGTPGAANRVARTPGVGADQDPRGGTPPPKGYE